MFEKLPFDPSEAPSRIMAVRNGEMRPLFDSLFQGPYSPSSSLLIEKHEIHPTEWQTVIIPSQLLTLHLRRSAVEYASESDSCRCVIRTKGSVVIEKRSCEQKFRWNSSASTLTVQLSDTILEQAAEAAASLSSSDLQSTDCAEHDMQLSSLLFALERECMQGYPAGRLFVDGIEQALASVLVHYAGITNHTHSMYKGGLAPYRMRRINEFVQAHIDKEITLNELAQDIGLSPSHFCSLFRKTSGTTPHQFVLHCRIQHAKALLAEPSHSILDVALASGFRTHQHFSRIFRRQVGIPPSIYRSQL